MKRWLAAPSAAAPVTKTATPVAVKVATAAAAPAAAATIAKNGIADFHAIADIVTPIPAVLAENTTTALYAAAHEYLYGTTELDPKVVANLDTWILRIVPYIPIFALQDITVNAGAKLVIGPANAILFARYITVQKTGTIVAGATASKIDCAGFKGN